MVDKNDPRFLDSNGKFNFIKYKNYILNEGKKIKQKSKSKNIISKAEAINRIKRKLLENSGLGSRYFDCTFESYDPSVWKENNPANLKKKEEIEEYAYHISEHIKNNQGLLLFSVYGGFAKTFFCAAITNVVCHLKAIKIYRDDPDFYQRGLMKPFLNHYSPVLYLPVPTFLNRYLNAINSGNEDEQKQYKEKERLIYARPVVIFDDVLKNPNWEFEFSKLFQWLDYFEQNKGHIPIIATNVDFKQYLKKGKENPKSNLPEREFQRYNTVADRIHKLTRGYQFVFEGEPEHSARQQGL